MGKKQSTKSQSKIEGQTRAKKQGNSYKTKNANKTMKNIVSKGSKPIGKLRASTQTKSGGRNPTSVVKRFTDTQR